MKTLNLSPDAASDGTTALPKAAKTKRSAPVKATAPANETLMESTMHELFSSLGHDTRSVPRTQAMVRAIAAGPGAKGGNRE